MHYASKLNPTAPALKPVSAPHNATVNSRHHDDRTLFQYYHVGLYSMFWQAMKDLLGIAMGILIKYLEMVAYGAVYISNIPLVLAIVIRRLFPIGQTASQETSEALSNVPLSYWPHCINHFYID